MSRFTMSNGHLVPGLDTAPRVVFLGPEAFFDQTTNWTLGTGTFRLKRTLVDHTAQRYLYATLPASLILPPAANPYLGHSIARVAALVEGSGFSSLPSSPARIRLQSPAGSVIASANEPGSVVGDINQPHKVFAQTTDVPLWNVTDPENDPLLVEFGSPFGGSGWGTYVFYGVALTIVPHVGAYYVGGVLQSGFADYGDFA